MNHRPLGYEGINQRIFNELGSAVGICKELKILIKTMFALLFGVGLGLRTNADFAALTRASPRWFRIAIGGAGLLASVGDLPGF